VEGEDIKQILANRY